MDVVHVATPNILHCEMARAVLKAGKHVLCEKPLAMNTRESAELVDLARASGLAAAVNYNIRFYPLCIEARDMVRARRRRGCFFHLRKLRSGLAALPDGLQLASPGGSGRGSSCGCGYWDALARSRSAHHWSRGRGGLCGFENRSSDPAASERRGPDVQGEGRDVRIETEPIAVTTEDFGSILLRLADDARGCLWVSQVTAGRKNCLRFEISGSRSALSW